MSETCMPKQAAFSGRRQAQQIEFTFHVHQVSVDERKSLNWPNWRSKNKCSVVQSAGQWTEANVFETFKLATHTGIPTAQTLSTKTFAVKRCSSMLFPR